MNDRHAMTGWLKCRAALLQLRIEPCSRVAAFVYSLGLPPRYSSKQVLRYNGRGHPLLPHSEIRTGHKHLQKRKDFHHDRALPTTTPTPAQPVQAQPQPTKKKRGCLIGGLVALAALVWLGSCGAIIGALSGDDPQQCQQQARRRQHLRSRLRHQPPNPSQSLSRSRTLLLT